MHAYTPEDIHLMGPATNLLSVLSVLMDGFSRVHAKRAEKASNDFKFDRFPSDGAAGMTVQGLTL